MSKYKIILMNTLKLMTTAILASLMMNVNAANKNITACSNITKKDNREANAMINAGSQVFFQKFNEKQYGFSIRTINIEESNPKFASEKFMELGCHVWINIDSALNAKELTKNTGSAAIGVFSGSQDIREKGGLIFNVRGGHQDEISEIMIQMNLIGVKRIGFVTSEKRGSDQFLNSVFSKKLKSTENKTEMTAVDLDALRENGENLELIVANLKSLKLDAIMIDAEEALAAKMLALIKKNKLKVSIFMSTESGSPENLVGDNASGVLIVHTIPMLNKNYKILDLEFKRDWMNYGKGQNITPFVMEGYLNAKILSEAVIQSNGSNDGINRTLSNFNENVGGYGLNFITSRSGFRVREITSIDLGKRLF